MSQIRVVYAAGAEHPSFPATDQHPDAEYYKIGDYWCVAIGGPPTQDDIYAVLAPTPSPLEQIRAIERTPEVSDAMQRGSRLVALSYAIDEVVRIAASKGQVVTRQQAHAWSMVNDANYKTLHDAETAIKPLRPQV